MTRLAILEAEHAEALTEYAQASYAEQIFPYGSDEYRACREETLAAARRVRQAREDLETEREARA